MALWGAAWGTGSSSGSVTTLLPRFAYRPQKITISATAGNKIAFTEGGGTLTATIASSPSGSGGWTPAQLCGKVKRALQAAGAGTYTVTYSSTTNKFTITKSAGTFTLDVANASVTVDALPLLGFNSDTSGALTYTSDTAVPATVTVTCTVPIRHPQLRREDRIEDTILESGYSQGAHLGFTERYEFFIEFEDDSIAQALRLMWDRTGCYKLPVTFYPNSADTTKYIEVYVDRLVWTEQTDQNVVNLYRVDFSLRFKRDGDATIDAGDFLSRAFS